MEKYEEKKTRIKNSIDAPSGKKSELETLIIRNLTEVDKAVQENPNYKPPKPEITIGMILLTSAN